MGIVVTSDFTMNSALPLDDRTQVADTTARDAIASGRRWEGMIVYVIADATNYQLVGGITNGDWAELSGTGGEPTIFGSRGSPRSISNNINVADGHMDNFSIDQVIFIKHNTANAETVATSAQIDVGTIIGQRMTLIGRSDDDVLILNPQGTTNIEINGLWYSYTGRVLCLMFDGTKWIELYRS